MLESSRRHTSSVRNLDIGMLRRTVVTAIVLTIGLIGCIGSTAHLSISSGGGSGDGGLPGAPSFPNSARLPDNSGVATSSNLTAFITSSPTAYKGIARSNNFGISSPFLEVGIQLVEATLAANGVVGTEFDTEDTDTGPIDPVFEGDDGPSVPIEVDTEGEDGPSVPIEVFR